MNFPIILPSYPNPHYPVYPGYPVIDDTNPRFTRKEEQPRGFWIEEPIIKINVITESDTQNTTKKSKAKSDKNIDGRLKENRKEGFNLDGTRDKRYNSTA